MNPCVNGALTKLKEIIYVIGNQISSEATKGYSSGRVQSLSQMALLMELSLSQEKGDTRSFLIQINLEKQAKAVKIQEEEKTEKNQANDKEEPPIKDINVNSKQKAWRAL